MLYKFLTKLIVGQGPSRTRHVLRALINRALITATNKCAEGSTSSTGLDKRKFRTSSSVFKIFDIISYIGFNFYEVKSPHNLNNKRIHGFFYQRVLRMNRCLDFLKASPKGSSGMELELNRTVELTIFPFS